MRCPAGLSPSASARDAPGTSLAPMGGKGWTRTYKNKRKIERIIKYSLGKFWLNKKLQCFIVFEHHFHQQNLYITSKIGRLGSSVLVQP